MGILSQVEKLISAKFSVMKTVLNLIELEARLAGLSILPLVVSICMLFGVLMTLWLFASALLGYGILLATNNVLLSLALVVLFLLCVFGALVTYLSITIKNLSFQKTRAYLFQNEATKHEQEKAIKSRNSNSRTNLTRTSP